MNLSVAMRAPFRLGQSHRSFGMFLKDFSAVGEAILRSPWTVLVCKFTIGLVSAYDVYLTIKYVDSLPMMELNPIGRWLMMLDDGPECQLSQIAGFISAKFAGNFIAIGVLELLANWKLRAASVVGLAVAGFQLLLFYFLLFGVNS